MFKFAVLKPVYSAADSLGYYVKVSWVRVKIVTAWDEWGAIRAAKKAGVFAPVIERMPRD